MKRNVIFFLLLFAASVSLSANGKYKTDYSLVLLDSVDVAKIVPTDSVAKISYTASTLLDAEGLVLDTSIVKLPKTYAWTIDPRFGDRMLAPMDTVRENFHRSALAEGRGIAVSYLGNIGGPLQSKEFFAQNRRSQFPFMDPISTWRRSPEKNLFLNTKVPYSNVFYQAGGGKEVAENHFKAELSSNFGKRLNVGFNFDYIYTRGFYTALFNKQTSYDFNASYIGEKYKMHLFLGNNNTVLSDNGGIENDKYITNPESEDLENTRGNSLDIPVIFDQGIKSKLRGRHVYVTNSYDIGRDQEMVKVDDTTSVWRRKENYIAPASVILTTHYEDQRRLLTSANYQKDITTLNTRFVPNLYDQTTGGLLVDGSGQPQPMYDKELNDYMSHYVLTNTLAFRMNEGFRDWTKFSLTAFVEYEMRKFLLPSATVPYVSEKESDNVLFFGGKLSKNQGRNIRFNATALKGINSNDLKLEGDVSTTFSLLGKDFTLRGEAYFKNEVPTYFQEHFRSRNWVYDRSFKDVKRIYGGGEIVFPSFSFSQTKVSGGYENISNHIYIGEEKVGEAFAGSSAFDSYRRAPMQSSKNVNVLAAKLDQKLKAGIFHVDFQILLQKSTEEDIIPLPLWTVYGNVYLKTMVSKVLTVQIGADSYMHAKYYAPGFDPLFGQFYTQRQGGTKLGNFPHTNAYINLHLKYTRFFIMAYNIGESLGNRQSFTTPHYPNDPFMIRWGLSWRFNN